MTEDRAKYLKGRLKRWADVKEVGNQLEFKFHIGGKATTRADRMFDVESWDGKKSMATRVSSAVYLAHGGTREFYLHKTEIQLWFNFDLTKNKLRMGVTAKWPNTKARRQQELFNTLTLYSLEGEIVVLGAAVMKGCAPLEALIDKLAEHRDTEKAYCLARDYAAEPVDVTKLLTLRLLEDEDHARMYRWETPDGEPAPGIYGEFLEFDAVIHTNPPELGA